MPNLVVGERDCVGAILAPRFDHVVRLLFLLHLCDREGRAAEDYLIALFDLRVRVGQHHSTLPHEQLGNVSRDDVHTIKAAFHDDHSRMRSGDVDREFRFFCAGGLDDGSATNQAHFKLFQRVIGKLKFRTFANTKIRTRIEQHLNAAVISGSDRVSGF